MASLRVLTSPPERSAQAFGFEPSPETIFVQSQRLSGANPKAFHSGQSADQTPPNPVGLRGLNPSLVHFFS